MLLLVSHMCLFAYKTTESGARLDEAALPCYTWLVSYSFLYATGNQAGAIDLLVRHGANVHQTTTAGDTALHVAAAQGSVAAIAALQTQVLPISRDCHSATDSILLCRVMTAASSGTVCVRDLQAP